MDVRISISLAWSSKQLKPEYYKKNRIPFAKITE